MYDGSRTQGIVHIMLYNLLSVSYTHLDVYKRQHTQWPFSPPRRSNDGHKPIFKDLAETKLWSKTGKHYVKTMKRFEERNGLLKTAITKPCETGRNLEEEIEEAGTQAGPAYSTLENSWLVFHLSFTIVLFKKCMLFF